MTGNRALGSEAETCSTDYAEIDVSNLLDSIPNGLARGVGPTTRGSDVHTAVTKTQALRQALDAGGCGAAFGGARRGEEKSRAKERVSRSVTRSIAGTRQSQRPEPWRLSNGLKRRDRALRVFPLSDWTELDVWLYIHHEQIPIVPLYFAASRPVVERGDLQIMLDDRLPLRPGRDVEIEQVRFGTLGCYPLTSAVESMAVMLPQIIAETMSVRVSERSGLERLAVSRERRDLLRFTSCGSVDAAKSKGLSSPS